MISDLTADDLRAFETEIANLFNGGEIRAPIHLSNGNEEQLIEIFRNIRAKDWVFCSWRAHYQCLLKGVPAERLREEIVSGRSIALCFPEFNIYSSAIVGGVLPIAVGTALALRYQGSESKVFCFLGDMTSETGIAHESIKYSRAHRLPIHFVVEDNRKSVCTDTREVWGRSVLTFEGVCDEYVTYYRYETIYPHAGAGVRVQF